MDEFDFADVIEQNVEVPEDDLYDYDYGPVDDRWSEGIPSWSVFA